MASFKHEDFKEFETYVRCRNCNYEIGCCASCERKITTDETIFCYIKKGKPNDIFHVCVECFEGEND